MDAPVIAQASGIDTGDTAWMLAATALVLMMTIALGLFYAGLVRSKNALNTFMMCVSAIGIAGITWALIGYSLAFDGSGDLIGGLHNVGLHDVTFEAREGTAIPELVFFAFQATFCIITVALISGAVVERMRFGTWMVFAALWSVLVYSVLAHWGFGNGWLQEGGTLDFAGGIAVEMASGFSAVAAAVVVGARKDYGRIGLLPHNSVLVLLGGGLLWFGWFGFNGGSGFGTGDPSVLAFTNTLLCPAATLFVWMILDLLNGRRVTAVGAATAIIAGCVLITPAGGFISPGWALVLGAAGALPVYAVILRRPRTGVDETLDVLAAHGVAGCPRDPHHRLRRPAVLERRLRRLVLRAHRAARGPGARCAGDTPVRVRRHLRPAQGDRSADAVAGPGARRGAGNGQRLPRRGGLPERRGRDPGHARGR